MGHGRLPPLRCHIGRCRALGLVNTTCPHRRGRGGGLRQRWISLRFESSLGRSTHAPRSPRLQKGSGKVDSAMPTLHGDGLPRTRLLRHWGHLCFPAQSGPVRGSPSQGHRGRIPHRKGPRQGVRFGVLWKDSHIRQQMGDARIHLPLLRSRLLRPDSGNVLLAGR